MKLPEKELKLETELNSIKLALSQSNQMAMFYLPDPGQSEGWTMRPSAPPDTVDHAKDS